jgi:hypothetical protein
VTQGVVLADGTRPAAKAVVVDAIGRERVRRACIALAVVAAVLVYANAPMNGFALDDGGVIVRNPLVTSPATAWRAFAMPYWPSALGGGQYRPLGILTFALDWAISGGDARWFHVMNVAWHAAATLLFATMAAELLAPVAAAIAALVFAVHPVHVEAVSNVVGRLEPMAAAFVLGALLLHRRSNRAAPALFALALVSKESAVVVLALAFANDVLLERDWRATLRARRWHYAGYGAVAVAYVVALIAVFHDQPFRVPARAFIGATAADRLAVVLRVIPHYARLLVVPAHLSASYAPNVISPASTFTAASASGLGIVAALVGATWVAARRRRWPVMAFALLWIPIAIAPVANVFFSSGVVLAERTLYLPSAGLCLAVGAVAERYVLHRSAMVAAATASVVLAFGIRTWTRTPSWRDDRTYMLILLADHPESYEAHYAMGRVLRGANALDDATRELALARRLYPRDPAVYREAADVADRQHDPARGAVLRDSARIAPTLTIPR